MQKYILHLVLYGCETWSLALREEHRLNVFENRVLEIFGPERDEMTLGGENCKMIRSIVCTFHQTLLG
jgi:hypothetical protein